MSDRLKISQLVMGAFAALLMSSLTVSAAVGPAHAVAKPAGVSIHA